MSLACGKKNVKLLVLFFLTNTVLFITLLVICIRVSQQVISTDAEKLIMHDKSCLKAAVISILAFKINYLKVVCGQIGL